MPGNVLQVISILQWLYGTALYFVYIKRNEANEGVKPRQSSENTDHDGRELFMYLCVYVCVCLQSTMLHPGSKEVRVPVRQTDRMFSAFPLFGLNGERRDTHHIIILVPSTTPVQSTSHVVTNSKP